jgi:hypothetical protein
MFCARKVSIYATFVTCLLLNVCLVSMAAAGHSVAAESGDDFERNIIAELKTQNPAAITVFNEANAARSKGDHRLAAELYRQVYQSAPRFVHALRRQCGEIIRLHDRAAG